MRAMQQLPLGAMVNNPAIPDQAHDAIVLLTRPQGASQTFALRVTQAFGPLRVEISPLMEIGFVPFDAEQAIGRTPVFTSMNGVDAWARAKLPVGGRCFCVGEATGQAARDLGFAPEVSGGTVEHLFEDIKAKQPDAGVVHIHGAHTRGDLVGRLQSAGIAAHGVAAYDQLLKPLTREARDIMLGGAQVIVPLFSPRTALQFAQECPAQARPCIVAISEAAADGWPNAVIAETPDAAGVLAAIGACLRGASVS